MKREELNKDQLSIFDLNDPVQRPDGAFVFGTDLTMSWANAFDYDRSVQGDVTDSVSDALIRSLTTLGKVDIEYMASITGRSFEEVINGLKGSIYCNPSTWDGCYYKGWETTEEYLSGNLLRKLNVAERANRMYPGQFEENIKAIKRALPQIVPTKDIYITLGSPWVPTDIIDEFITYMLELRIPYRGTLHDELTGTWEIPNKAAYGHRVRAESTYGTPRIPALHILERTLNMRTVAVTDEAVSWTNPSGKTRIVNKPETVLAIEKQQKMIKDFQRWVWKNEARKERLESIFERNFSCVRRRIFDGSFLSFPTMSQAITLYPYQKDAVARILFTPNTLLAHDVGSGKTYVMIAAGMELKRMGLSSKNMYVVPNNIVGQWQSIFRTMYPQANLLVIEPKNFGPAVRENVMKRLRDEVFDGIIIAYSCFEQIPLSKEYYVNKLTELREEIASLERQKGKATSRLKKKRETIQKELSDLVTTVSSGSRAVYFDELGVTRLFIDEAHNFKNVPLETKTSNVLGISSVGSKRCKDMLDKVRTVQKNNDGKGVVLATGTPITNSITDAFVVQQYLQSGELAMLDLQSFDSWVGMFAERTTEFEIDVDTNSYRLATRFAKFHNLPELTALLSSVADFHMVDVTAGIPETDGYDDAVIGKTLELGAYLENISKRADEVRNGVVARKEDNMLKITTDGRKAALDLRLVVPEAGFTYQCKVARCADNVASIYFKTEKEKSAQLVFCDTSTPKAGFNIYDELKRLLLQQGVREEHIAYIHDATTEARREKLFAQVRKGEVRVLIGSTFKLGLGVNVQDKLIALHHLDVPWRPADMTQREGRILRQGNTNPKVRIFRYITEGSFDAYSWQLLETKARFIADLLSGSLADRSGGDVSDTVLDYAEVKALAVGNPLVKKRVETANELSRYLTLQRKMIEMRLHLEKMLSEIPSRKERQVQLIEKCDDDTAFYAEWRADNPEVTDPRLKREEADRRKALREQIQAAVTDNVLKDTESVLLTYRGFDLVLPANMTAIKPYLYLQRRGRYYVELSDNEVGNLLRIDNFLNGLEEHGRKLREGLAKLEQDEKEIRRELSKDENYIDRIEACKKRLETIDKKLGAKKK